MHTQIRMPAGVRYIIETLAASGFEAYAVGGCVRDSLMGRIPADWDITTSAVPDELLRVFKNNRVIPTGIKHGTVTILCKGGQFEVTTYRVDGAYTDGRRPDNVTFSASLEEDLKRRDFTINAMAYNDAHGLQDFFGGAADLENKIIRCVGDPKERFAEDYLRMLRAYRFAATLGFSLEPSVVETIAANRAKVKGISAERIQSELNKLLLSGDFAIQRAFFDVFADVLLPEVAALRGVEQNNAYHCHDVYDHSMAVLAHTPPELCMRLSALLHDVGKARCRTVDDYGVCHFYKHESKSADMAAGILKRLKYDNETMDTTLNIIRFHGHCFRPEPRAVKKLIGKLGVPLARHVLRFFQADTMGKSDFARERSLPLAEACMEALEAVVASGEPCALSDLAVNGKDVMDILRLPPGREVGDMLHALLDRVQAEPALNTREALTALMENLHAGQANTPGL